MTQLKGKLLYTGWLNRPWRLIQTDGTEVDLYPFIDAALTAASGKRADHEGRSDSYRFFFDENSKFLVEYKADRRMLLNNRNEFGFSNIYAHFESTLVSLSGRLVDVTIDDSGFSVVADKNEKVFGVKFFPEITNSCRVPDGAEHSVCGIGTSNCCIFLAAGTKGFSCEKFNGPVARMILDRHAKGVMRASRIGNCALLGREEDPLKKKVAEIDEALHKLAP